MISFHARTAQWLSIIHSPSSFDASYVTLGGNYFMPSLAASCVMVSFNLKPRACGVIWEGLFTKEHLWGGRNQVSHHFFHKLKL